MHISLEDKNRLIQKHVGVDADGIWGSGSADAVIDALGIELPADPPREMKELGDPEAFFNIARKQLFGGQISQTQNNGIMAKVTAYGLAGWPISWAAYGMATSYWETNKTMQPIIEAYWLSEDWRKENLRYYPWYGRGDVQLTWEKNYRKADRELELNGTLIANPERALEPEISARIMVHGMEQGWFSSHDLRTHLPDEKATREQFKEARRIINGADKDSEIADIALIWQAAFTDGGWRKVKCNS